MAPRRRPRKVGLKRIDAAIDALLPYGFTKDLICNTVNSLLKIYGDEGWVFIEEASYKLVIDTILEDQEKGLLEMDNSENHREPNESMEPLALASTSKTGAGQAGIVAEALRLTTETCEDPAESVPCRDVTCVAQVSRVEQIVHALPISENPARSVELLRTSTLTRRRPCFGWISDDDECEEKASKDAVGGERKRQAC